MVLDGLYYTKEHEWAKVDGEIATVGITDYAQSELGDVVYIELPSDGKSVSVGDAFSTIEAVKAVSDVYSPVSGEIIEVHKELATAPDLINKDPYGDGWIIKVKMSNPDDLKNLLSADEYRKLIGE
ncbi:glycine cleavage system protein GcvH [bacterium]|nr:MAG: glycine cleavage system protein GcvH [bacterium]